MRIDCPCCGLRDSGEFSFLGDAAPKRPTGFDAAPEAMFLVQPDTSWRSPPG